MPSGSEEDSRPILVIPDIHQDVEFLDTILARHPSESLAEIVLLGDLLDSRKEEYQTSDALIGVLRQIRSIDDRGARRLTQLLGNHDWDYLRMWSSMRAGRNSPFSESNDAP